MANPRKSATAAPRVMAPAKPGDNVRAVLMSISVAAASATVSRAVLIDRIKAFADHPTSDQVKLLQSAVILGYCAGRLARAAGRDTAAADDMVAAAAMLAKKGASSAKANAPGHRTDDEERIYGGARVYWSGLNVAAGTAPEAGTATGRAVGGAASAAKRAARTVGGSVDVTPPRAAPARTPTPQPAGKAATPLEVINHLHASAATLMAYVEAHKALMTPKALTAATKALATLRGLPDPTH